MEHRLLARFRTPRQRLGLGAILAACVHLGLLTLLVLQVTRAGRSLVDGDGSEGDRIDISTVGEPGRGLPGPVPTSGAERSGEDGEEAARPATVQRSAPRVQRRAPTGTRAAALPARGPAAGPAPRALARATGAQLLATTTPTAIDVGGAGGERSPLPGTAAPAGPSPLDAFRAELKQRMRAAWRAREVYYRIDPHGKMQGSLLVTRLHVRLRADGTVEKAEMQDSSGVAALDTEAMGAIKRMKPLSRLPPALVDRQGGFLVSCGFYLDLGQYRFANHLRRAVADLWRPARAYMSTGDTERVTRVRLMLSREGALMQAQVIGPSGLEFLDENALNWARPGTSLPRPPPAFYRGPGHVPVFVAFHHLAGQVHFLWPREDPDAE